MSAPYHRDQIEEVLIRTALASSERIFPKRFLATPLGTGPGDSRFAASASGFTVLYASPDFATAFIETVVRDRFTRKTRRAILFKEISERGFAQLMTGPRKKLRLLDLRRDGCLRLGAPTDVVNARHHAAGRALGRAIYTEHRQVDGFLFASRLTGSDVYAVFDRAVDKLAAKATGELQYHLELPSVLNRHKITLTITD